MDDIENLLSFLFVRKYVVAFFGLRYVNCVTNLQETNSKKVKDYRKNANEFHTMLAWSTASAFFSLSIKIADR